MIAPIVLFMIALVGCIILLWAINNRIFGDGFVFGWRNRYDDDILLERDGRFRRLLRKQRRRRRRNRRVRNYERKLDRKFERSLRE